MKSFDQETGVDLDGLDQELLEELGRQSLDAIQKLRADARIDVRLAVTLQRGDSSRRGERAIVGHTKDLSPGGSLLLLGAPPGVGDIYQLSFDDQGLGLSRVFARCLRVRLIREDLFESGFQFFTRLELPQDASAASGPRADLFD